IEGISFGLSAVSTLPRVEALGSQRGDMVLTSCLGVRKKGTAMRRRKHVDPIPEEFASYEEAGEFWDTHDTTDYPEPFVTVEFESRLRRSRYEIEIDPDVVKVLRTSARRRGVSAGHLASDILRQELTTHK